VFAFIGVFLRFPYIKVNQNMKAPPPVVAENGLVAAVPSAGVWFICGAADIGWRPTALIFVLN